MIINFLLNFIVLVVGSVFSLLPNITTLPSIAGFDIDGALVTGMGEVNAWFQVFWPLHDMFIGFLVLMGYYIGKMTLIFLFGSRTPGAH